MLSCIAILAGLWQGGERLLNSTVLNPKTSVAVNFCLVFFRALDHVSPAAGTDVELFVAGTEHTLKLLFSPGLLASQFCSHEYLLKLSVLPTLEFLNPISDIIC